MDLPSDLLAAVNARPERMRAGLLKKLADQAKWTVQTPAAPQRHAEPGRSAPLRSAPAIRRSLPCVSLGAVQSHCPHLDPSRHIHICNDPESPYLECMTGREMQFCKRYRAVDDLASIKSVRHLLYYVYPVHGNGVWQRNLDELFKREELFDGTRTVAIARGPAVPHHPRPEATRPPHSVDPPDAVRAYLQDFASEVIIIDNNPDRGETEAFMPLWTAAARHGGYGDRTFYGHAKGVTRTVDPSISVHPWTALLYAANLDYWPLVQKSLEQSPITGALRYAGVWPPGSTSPRSAKFHYSGAFFWFRNRDVFSRDWKRINKTYGGVERWPGLCFNRNESGCVFGDNLQELPLPYDFPRLRQLMAEFSEWSEAHADARRPGARSDPWLPYCGYE